MWTPAALSSETVALAGTCWRLVEAQHRVSTLKLVDSLDEQARIEELIETSKPLVPQECAHLDYLLSTPFRYGAPYPNGSRFRRAGYTEGVYYAGEVPATAVAEMVYYRLLFFAESPQTPLPANPAEYTAFAASYASGRSVDLTRPQLNADADIWTDPADYSGCQALADSCRQAAVDVIRYHSVRDPAGGANLALLSCSVFTEAEPTDRQTWRIHLTASGAIAICDYPNHRLQFDRGEFGATFNRP